MLISDQAKDLCGGRGPGAGAVCLLFNRWFTSGILNKSTVSESRKVPCDDLMHQSIPPLPPPPPPGYCRAFARLVSPGGGAFANFAQPGAGHLPNPGPFPSF